MNNEIYLRDYCGEPTVFNINALSMANKNYRLALWTGKYLQVTLMSIPVGGEIGLEVHPDTDQFIRITGGMGLALLGDRKDNLTKRVRINGNYAVVVPAGTWHNIKNIGRTPLKIYTIYAPPHHPEGTIQRTKAEADKEE